MRRSHLILWLPCVLYYGFITFLSDVPGSQFSGLVVVPFPHFDKFVHFVIYSFLGMVVARALSWEEYYHKLRVRWFVYFALLIPALALLDEVHQSFVPNRTMDAVDWLADLLGAGLGGLIYILVIRGRWSRGKYEDIERRDVRGLGLILAMLYFLFLISLNVLDYKSHIFAGYEHLAFSFLLAEYGLLGLLTIRFFYLRYKGQFFPLKVWLYLGLLGALFLFSYQVTFWYLKESLLDFFHVFWCFFSFMLGAFCYYLDKQIEKFRKRIVTDPLYKRRTWQRLYFATPAILIFAAIFFMASRPGQILYSEHIPMPQKVIAKDSWFSYLRNYFVLHTVLYFTYSTFLFRAISWESWWHSAKKARVLWLAGILILTLTAVGDEVVQFYTPNRYYETIDLVMDLFGGLLGMLAYLKGYRYLKRKFAPVEQL